MRRRKALWIAVGGVVALVFVALAFATANHDEPAVVAFRALAERHGLKRADPKLDAYLSADMEEEQVKALIDDCDALAARYGMTTGLNRGRQVDHIYRVPGNATSVYVMVSSAKGSTMLGIYGHRYTMLERIQRWWDDRHAE